MKHCYFKEHLPNYLLIPFFNLTRRILHFILKFQSKQKWLLFQQSQDQLINNVVDFQIPLFYVVNGSFSPSVVSYLTPSLIPSSSDDSPIPIPLIKMSSHVKEILPNTNEEGNTNEEAVCKSKLFWFFVLKRFIRATIAVVIKQRVLSKKKRKTQRYGADVFLLLSISILGVLAMVLGEKESDTPFKKKESDTNEEGDTNKVAKYKSILFRVFLVQIGLLALINVDAIKLIQQHGYCADAFLLLFITILGVLAVVLGHIGSSQNQTLYLKIYLILTIISMSIRFVTTDDKLSEVFYNEDVQTYKIYKVILETLMPILATIFRLPLIRKLSSSSICHYYKNE